ncbi:MAG TPA: hypothetical protein PKI93_04680 [Alphaproteobacteria bacterium]|nr:hypothetical protein [Alphaproteobacteria bacterium]HNS44762.1 hypothetical protein [Alphaproteobacteria bacterium]
MYANPAEWKHFSSGSHKAEGRLLHSPKPSGDLIIYAPGYSGIGAKLFEDRFSDLLLEEEYSQIILRHNGTLLNAKDSDSLLNREKFPKAVPFHDGDYIGGAPSRLAERFIAPKTVIEAIGANYTNITLVGHSLGVVAVLHSLALLKEECNPLFERVRACVCMAPAVGVLKEHDDDIMDTLWNDAFLKFSSEEGIIAMGSPEDMKADLLAVYQNLPERVANNLQAISKIFVHVERDEFLRYEDIDEFVKACGQNCRFITDRFDRHDPRLPYAAHDMPNYPKQSMLDVIEGRLDPIDTITHSDGFIE